jgi:hypothetical protein
LLALGEFVELEECALALKNHLKAAEQVEEHPLWMAEVQKLGANAAWMLGNWKSLEEFLEGDILESKHDVELNNNASFYRAILAVHKENYSLAMSLIHETREQLSETISSLLSESYSRAYRAMVSMQILAEMEEVVELKQSSSKPTMEVEHMSSFVSFGDLMHSPMVGSSYKGNTTGGSGADDATARGKLNSLSNNDYSLARLTLIRKWKGRLQWAPKEVDVFRLDMS